MSDIEVHTPLVDHIETDIKIIGDKITNVQIVYLLSYIRDVLQSGQTATVKLSIGKNRVSDFFAIQVNEQDIKQVCPVEEFEIN
jgi:hypothetical protein